MKKLIMESLLVLTIVVFMVSSAMAEKPEDVIDNSNVFQSGKDYTLIMTGKSGKGKKATTTTELQTFDPYISPSDGDDTTMEQLRMILFLLCISQDSGKLYR
jgi:hypothetical protein